MAAKLFQRRFLVLGRQKLAQRHQVVGQFVVGITQHLLQAGRQPEGVGTQVPVPQPVAGSLHRQLEPVAAFLKLLFQLLVIRDVDADGLVFDHRAVGAEESAVAPAQPYPRAVRQGRRPLGDAERKLRSEDGHRRPQTIPLLSRQKIGDAPADKGGGLPAEPAGIGGVDEGERGIGKVPADQAGLFLDDGADAAFRIAGILRRRQGSLPRP